MLVANPFANARSMGTPGNASTPAPQDTSNTIPKNKGDNTEDLNKIDPNKKILTGDEPLVDPVEQMSRLWEDDPIDPKNPKPSEETFLPAIDPKKLQERLSTVDFRKSIKPEVFERIKAGGDDGVVAMMEAITAVGHQAMMTSFMAAHKMTEAGLSSAEGRFLGKVPEHITDAIARDGVNSTVAASKDPRFAPFIDGIRARFQKRFPKSTASEISTAVNKYVKDFMDVNTPKNEPTEESLTEENTKALRTGSEAANWETWFESDLVGKTTSAAK